MMPTILLVQFRTTAKAAELEHQSITRELGELVQVMTVSALDTGINWLEPLPWVLSYQGFIFGGSGDFDFDGGRSDVDEVRCTARVLLERLCPLLTYIFSEDIPTLGICFGHQLLGRFAGAEVVYDQVQGKTKSHRVTVVADCGPSSLLLDVPDTFDGHYIHKDVLDRLPIGAELLCHGGEACQFSVLRYRKNIYTTQFHPELTFDDVLIRIDTFPDYLPAGVTAEQVFSHDGHSNAIVANFGRLIRADQTEQ